MSEPAKIFDTLQEQAATVLVGNEEIVERLFIALLTDGHVLLEGPPGVAKTTISRLFASLSDLEYDRIQMMPDLLPSDITGTEVYREELNQFEFRKGPVFSNVVLADEINRATPKTQSALLEAMEEGAVTVGSKSMSLPAPFLMIATQNPIETEGTYELPLAQRDRFQFKLRTELPAHEMERELVDRFDSAPDLAPEDVESVVSVESLIQAKEDVKDVHVDDSIKNYIVDIVEKTRDYESIQHGASPRASLSLLNSAKAKAAIEGRDYVIPSDARSICLPVLAHRIVLESNAEFTGKSRRDIISELLSEIKPPSGRVRDQENMELSDGHSEEQLQK